MTRLAAVAGLLLAAATTPALAAPRLAAPGLVTSSAPATVTAASISLAGFQFAGITTLARGPGTVNVLTFVMSTASMRGFALAVPCHPATGGFQMQFNLAVPSSSTVVSTSAMTLYATELAYLTTDTTLPPPAVPPYRWTVASPPPQHLLAADSGTLTAVSIALTRLDAPELLMTAPRSTSSFC